ncbi:DinB family protein [Aquimarina brevivitae]|uniref:DinB family protein n=1 Tax=Aquimarina brevivitae TaxID=323412 RepID=A0A4Q7PJN7_9FLAO|nr:DinB family protein [Aquimarina brevivitae]RZS99122.1 DinB family protein [Aquimarina brevivitae]
MQHPLHITRVNRQLLTKILEQHTLDQLNKIPEGFSNNLIWNIAHTVVTQQLLMYKLSGNAMLVSEELVAKYQKGTKAEAPVHQDEVKTIKELLIRTIDQTEKDLASGLFTTFNEYPTSTGFVLKSIDDALHFNNFHEGIHIGYCLALKKGL